MFWIGFGAGTGAAFLLMVLFLAILFWRNSFKDEESENELKVFREEQRKKAEELFNFWEISTQNQAIQIDVLRDISNQIRG